LGLDFQDDGKIIVIPESRPKKAYPESSTPELIFKTYYSISNHWISDKPTKKVGFLVIRKVGDDRTEYLSQLTGFRITHP